MNANIKILITSTIMGAVAGAAAAWAVTCCNKSSIAVANVQEIVGASSKVQELQTEQRARIENLAMFVQKANDEIGKEKSDKVKKELENKYMEELAVQKAEFEKEYIQKLAEISNNLSDAINEKAAEKGYNIVLSKEAVVAGAKDITEELIEAIK